MFDIEVTPVGCVKTLPDTDNDGNYVEGTGGRYDFFFFVKAADVPKIAIKRFEFGMRWWSDIYLNKGDNIYPPEFCTVYSANAVTQVSPTGVHGNIVDISTN